MERGVLSLASAIRRGCSRFGEILAVEELTYMFGWQRSAHVWLFRPNDALFAFVVILIVSLLFDLFEIVTRDV